jgi:hypothetical protein
MQLSRKCKIDFFIKNYQQKTPITTKTRSFKSRNRYYVIDAYCIVGINPSPQVLKRDSELPRFAVPFFKYF